MEIPNNYLVCDIRTSKDFKGATISGYKKADVIHAFQNAIINNRIEEALYWNVELHNSTYTKEIWNSIINVYLKYIHINNPKLFFYILQRENDYNKIIEHYPKNHYLFTRNNQEIRNLFCDLVCTLTLSKKNNIFLDKSLPKVNLNKITKEDIKNRILTENYNIVQDLNCDSLNNTEILCINQMFHNLNNHQGTLKNCFYWYLLLEKSSKEKDKINKENINDIVHSATNIHKNSMLNYVTKEKIHWNELIFKMLEKILMNNQKNNMLIHKLKSYYQIHFKPAKVSSLKYIYFIIFSIIKNDINWNQPLIHKYSIYIQCCANINQIYSTISQNILNKLDSFDRELYVQKFYEAKEKMIKNNSKEVTKIYEENNNINLNKIIKGNPLKPKYTTEDLHDEKQLINKNKTKQDVIDAKEEKTLKKLDFFNQMIVKKRKNTIYQNQNINENLNQNQEIRELFIQKKKK
jgi:hypothetical protein